MAAATYAKHVSTRQTPQSEPIPGSSQVPNSAGGFAWQVDCWMQLDRFLQLGNKDGSYYADERKMTEEAASCIYECAAKDLTRTVNRIVEASQQGLVKNETAEFAIAMLSRHGLALAALSLVCRIGTHVLHFPPAVEQFRGWGHALKRVVAAWYNNQEPDDLAYQMTKYQSRDGWSHIDVLRMCHAEPRTPGHNACFRWAKDKSVRAGAPELLNIFTEVQSIQDETRLCQLIVEHRLAREILPTEWLNKPAVWEALLEDMPYTAMIRSLGKMANVGLLKPMSAASQKVVSKLADAETLRKARVHPIAILLALSVYKQGRGLKGSLSWSADSAVVDALDAAFYTAFQAVEPTGKRYLLALDVSGSMEGGYIAGSFLSPRDASAALAMVTVQTEQLTHTMGFTAGRGAVPSYNLYDSGPSRYPFTVLPFHKRQSLTEAVEMVSDLPFGGTDCALPMLYAMEKGLEVDVFVVYTDNETWAGEYGHPAQALVQYRQKTGIPAKLIVVGMVANKVSIADPNDAGMMDVVGFDTSVPKIMSDFAKA